LKKNLIVLGILILTGILVLTSSTAIASDVNNLSFTGISFEDKDVYVLDHAEDLLDGNWITMGSPDSGTQSFDQGRGIKLPPTTIKYSGPRFERTEGISGNLSSLDSRSFTINYPSDSSYVTLPVYLPNEEVTMSFHGDPRLKGNVSIYVFNVTKKAADGILGDITTSNISNLGNVFDKNMVGNHINYSAVLDENGDLLNYNLGLIDPGMYCIAMVQKTEDGNLIILSETAFIVTHYELKVTAPTSIDEGKNLDIKMLLESAPSSINFTYGAVLVNEQVYNASIEVNSNGTYNSTSVKVNGENFTDRFELNASNYKSKFTRNEVQEKVQELIGEGNGSIAIGEIEQKNLSLTAYDLPKGHYYLFIGAYSPQTKIAGLAQREIGIGPIPPEPPVANLKANPTNGYVPLSVQFTDSSQNVDSRSWDFGDGSPLSTAQNPKHTYSKVGTYTTNLTVINANGMASKLATITVFPKTSIHGHHNLPKDPNNDGLYEDVNGNGIQDFDDIVVYYDNMDWIENNAPVNSFDHNKNGLIDFDDIVKLYHKF
jgi:methanogen extracellular protein (TIGR04279 family)